MTPTSDVFKVLTYPHPPALTFGYGFPSYYNTHFSDSGLRVNYFWTNLSYVISPTSPPPRVIPRGLSGKTFSVLVQGRALPESISCKRLKAESTCVYKRTVFVRRRLLRSTLAIRDTDVKTGKAKVDVGDGGFRSRQVC